MLAAFFNQLPMIIDELQLAKDNKGRAQFDVNGLAEGVGRTRGNKSGGVAATPTWANTIITSGETPLINIGASAGAVNRVIEIEGSEEHKFIEDGHKTASILRENYGHAGKAFVEEMYGENREANLIRAKELYEQYTAAFYTSTADKQSNAACICVVIISLTSGYSRRQNSHDHRSRRIPLLKRLFRLAKRLGSFLTG